MTGNEHKGAELVERVINRLNPSRGVIRVSVGGMRLALVEALATKDAELSALRGAYEFVKLVGRLEHSADDDVTYRNDGDSFDALDRLIAMARDLMTPAAALTHQEKDAQDVR